MIGIIIIVSCKKHRSSDPSYRYAILLGVHYPSDEFICRQEAALQYWRFNNHSRIICSGGQGSDEECSEARAYYNYLKEHGVPDGNLLIEDHSTGTVENMRNSLNIISGCDTIPGAVIITSDYHVPRSLIIARKCGFKDVTAYPAYYRTISWPNYALRELFALIHLL